MSQDPLNELLQFLKPDSREDLKHTSLDHLMGISSFEQGMETLIKKDGIIQSIIELTDDKIEAIARNALYLLVNVTSTTNGATEVLKYKPEDHKNVIELLIAYVLNPQKRDADAACMILCNISRLEDELVVCIDTFIPHLNNLLNAFVKLEFNQKESTLDYLALMFSNLSRNHRIRKWLTEENPHIPLIKLLPFCICTCIANVRRGGALTTVKNLCFDLKLHDLLLSTKVDLLFYLLYPLMGNEEYPDEEMDKLPMDLQYLPVEKKRDNDPSLRMMHLETLNKLCSKRSSRETLRENGVCYVLREYHKWEMEPRVLLECENILDILKRKEEEGAEDVSAVEVLEQMSGKFKVWMQII